MTTYIIRRVLYGIPIILGVLLLLFVLFFLYAEPEALEIRAADGSPRAARITADPNTNERAGMGKEIRGSF